MNSQDKVNLYHRLLREAKAKLRVATDEVYWMRTGDWSDYLAFDNFTELVDDLVSMEAGSVIEWREYGFETTEFSGNNYISLYVGEEGDEDPTRDLDDEERQQIEAALGRYAEVAEEEAALVPIANPEARDNYAASRPQDLFYMTFGAYGWDKVLVWADSVEKAIEAGAAWLADTSPGDLISEDSLFNDTGLWDEARQELGPDASEEALYEYVSTDLHYTESGYLDDWTINDVYDEAEIDEAYRRSQELEVGEREASTKTTNYGEFDQDGAVVDLWFDLQNSGQGKLWELWKGDIEGGQWAPHPDRAAVLGFDGDNYLYRDDAIGYLRVTRDSQVQYADIDAWFAGSGGHYMLLPEGVTPEEHFHEASTKTADRMPSEDLTDLRSWVDGTVIVAGEGTITLYDNDPGEPVNVAIVHDSSGFQPTAALVVDQYLSEEECVQAAYDVLMTWSFEHHRDWYDELVAEHGDDAGSEMFTEGYAGRAWSGLNAKGVADIIESDKFAAKYIDIDRETQDE